jgi:putative tricarboxylic transport membrane protein
MRFNDAILGVIIAAFAVFVISLASTFPGLPGQDYGPAFFPTIIGIVFLICAAILIVQGLKARHETGWVKFGEWAKSPHHIINFVIVLSTLVGYIWLSDFIGFIPISIVVLWVLMYRFGVGKRISAALSIGVTFLIHTIFYKYLLVPLPWGLLDPIAW